MDTVELSRAPALAAKAFPAFEARAPWWGGDLQTVRNYIVGRRVHLDAGERLLLEVRDGSGDRLAATLNLPVRPAPARPLALLLHGLSGCEESFYILKTAKHLLECGFTVLRLNLRGAGGSRQHCRFQYHAGRSEDLADALAALPRPLVAAGVVAIGFSLGGNMLLKYLGERGGQTEIRAAVTVSAPLDLDAAAVEIMRPRNAVYHRYLLRAMQRESLGQGAELTAGERVTILSVRSIREFDDRFTARRNRFRGADDYYARNSSRHFLDGIAVPALLIHAADDPWIPSAPYLVYRWQRNPNLLPLLAPRGGHVGFQGRDRQTPWHDHCITRFLTAL
jgi:predicted alpha/beta-fold hydrolase